MRKGVVLGALLLVFVATTACTPKQDAAGGTGDTSQTDNSKNQGAAVARIGQPLQLKSESGGSAEVTVIGVTLAKAGKGEFAEKPANGQFAVVDVQIKVTQGQLRGQSAGICVTRALTARPTRRQRRATAARLPGFGAASCSAAGRSHRDSPSAALWSSTCRRGRASRSKSPTSWAPYRGLGYLSGGWVSREPQLTQPSRFPHPLMTRAR